ncbi:type 2 lantipeptide synthetase [Streptococcus ruminantium]|uniref:Type 2 lantipeptide synthetase n=2 Tax=Streptococcus ruminantium TaxID=1917441 RepID=A0A2Z5TML4_9STRE|nr:type 2 lantipeptide synthetase [Streptococcus ruminantium]
MVLAEMARKLNKKIDLFELAKYFIEVNEYDDCLEIDLSVCHGAAGIVQSLLFVYATLTDRRF